MKQLSLSLNTTCIFLPKSSYTLFLMKNPVSFRDHGCAIMEKNNKGKLGCRCFTIDFHLSVLLINISLDIRSVIQIFIYLPKITIMYNSIDYNNL